VVAILARNPQERNIWTHLLLTPIIAYVAPRIMRNTPPMPKAGVIRGCIGSASDSSLPALDVALLAAVLEAVGSMDVVLEVCLAVEAGLDEVEFPVDVNDPAEPED
jgi:hypothetical protein